MKNVQFFVFVAVFLVASAHSAAGETEILRTDTVPHEVAEEPPRWSIPVANLSGSCRGRPADFDCRLIDAVAPLRIEAPGTPWETLWRATFRINGDCTPTERVEFCCGLLWFRLTKLRDGGVRAEAMYQRVSPGAVAMFVAEFPTNEDSKIQEIERSRHIMQLTAAEVPGLWLLARDLQERVSIPIVPETLLTTGSCSVEGVIEATSGTTYLSTPSPDHGLHGWLKAAWRTIAQHVPASPVYLRPGELLEDSLARLYPPIVEDDCEEDWTDGATEPEAGQPKATMPPGR